MHRKSSPPRVSLIACTSWMALLVMSSAAQAQNAAAAPVQPGISNSPDRPSVDTEPNRPTGIESSPQAPASEQARDEAQRLGEIVVTAQKREQRLQDVPIAVTAITSAQLQANRVVTVNDLSGLAPNVTARNSAGGSQIPAFTARGLTSYGVVPGSDKEFSIYLDGVYLGSSHSLFDLPDIERIEVLRGPQGTLFGRNATTGAVSIVTRDPAGAFGVHQDLTVGNYGQIRSRTTIDTPTFGPISAYGSYVHDERHGDIRNLGAGVVWDRTGPNTRMGRQFSPRRLGGKNSEQFFAAVKFEPNDTLKAVYKFDYQTNHFTPEGVAVIALPAGGLANTFAPALGPLAPLYAAYFNTIIAANSPSLDSSGKRPEAVNNSWTVGGYQRVYGHNLTAELELSDRVSLKNIASYRYSFVTSASQIDGIGGLVVPSSAVLPYATFLAATGQVPGIPTNFLALPPATQAAIAGALAQSPAIQSLAGVGNRFVLTSTNAQSLDKQYSDELQANYSSKSITVTLGALYFHQKSITGGPQGIMNTPAFAFFPANGRIPLGAAPGTSNSGQSDSFNKGESIAGYGQIEVHLRSNLDLVLGGRVTHDKKSGTYTFGGTYVPPAAVMTSDPRYYTGGSFIGITSIPFDYKSTRVTYSGGVNYKPSEDILVYAKYSTGFVSGGSIAGIAWEPETVRSIEGGLKADFLDRRLRANLALFHARYKNVQTAQGGTTLGRPEIGTAIISLGDERAEGAEVELTAVPVRNLTLGANAGFTRATYTRLTSLFVSAYGTGYKPTLLPRWTSNLYGQFRSEPVSGNARILARVDADWRSRVRFISGSRFLAIPEYIPYRHGPARWILNARLGIEDLGPMHLNIAAWSRNLTNNKDRQFPLALAGYDLASSFQQARTYGLDVSLRF